jgi:hypothetical protein
MCQPSGVDTWRTTSFWTKNLTKVLIWSFPKTEVSSVIRTKTQELKNKVFKTKRPKIYIFNHKKKKKKKKKKKNKKKKKKKKKKN